jgi:hypothetical protein
MTPTHYHLMLYHLGTALKDIRRVEDRSTAAEDARVLTRQVQAHLGATTYTVRAEPCALVHFPEQSRRG